jgi:uncharacterized protein
MTQKNLWWTGAALALVGAAAVLLDALVLEKYFFKTKFFDIGTKGSNKQIKIVLLTDLHFKDAVLPHYRKLADKLHQLKPDLLLITGDTLDSTGKIEPVQDFFDLLDPKLKKVAIPGNNDYRAGPSISRLQKVMEDHNCDLLVNESKAYTISGTRIMVTGLDDLLEGNSCFRDAVKEVGNEEHHLLLVHSPLQQENARAEIERINKKRNAADKLNIRYIFAGHTHGGQVRLPGYVPVLPGKSGNYVNGWYNDNAPYLYVSRGFGTSSIPLRFFAKSEVTVFNYHV